MRPIACCTLLASALVCVAGEARAQDSMSDLRLQGPQGRLQVCGPLRARLGLPAPPGPTFVEKKVDDGQSVVFKDDPLAAVNLGAFGAEFTGFHPPRRFYLIRPRPSFVSEMLKSVEAL